MIVKTTVILAVLAAATPSFAQMKSGDAMASGDAMMASGDKMSAMKPMTPAQKAVMAKCAKMTPAVAAKNAKCAKMSAMHPASHM
jgi:hypothetical protein